MSVTNGGSNPVPVPAPQVNKPLSEEDVIALKALEGVLSESYIMYCPEQLKPLVDKLSDSGTTEFVEFHPGTSPGYFYMVASNQGTRGAVPVKESDTRATATINVRVPMRIAGVKRPADGRKERYPIEWDEKSPFGRALRIYTQPLGNEPIKVRKKKSSSAKPDQAAPEAAQPEAGGEPENT